MERVIEREDRQLVVDGSRVRILFGYDPAVVAAVKLVKGAKFDGAPGRKFWWIPARMENLTSLAEFARVHEFTRDPKLHALCLELRDGRKENLAGSRAADADLEPIAGLGGELDPYQRAGVAYLVRNKRGLLADEMGLGKTIQALATLQALTAFPAVVVCPAFLALNWQREARVWLPGKTVHVVGIDGPLPTSRAQINVISYDRMADNVEGLRALDPAAVVLDEAHFLKDAKTIRTKAALRLVHGLEVVFLLTGTPLVNRPLDLIPLLKLLGRIDDLGGERTFKERYCEGRLVPTWIRGCKAIGGLPCEPVTFETVRAKDEALHREGDEVLQRGKTWMRFVVTIKYKDGPVILSRAGHDLERTREQFDAGEWFRVVKRMDASGSGDLKALGRELRRTCMIRRRKADVLLELPPKRRAWVPVTLSNQAEYQRAEKDVLAWIGDKAAEDPAFRADLRGMTPGEQLRAMCVRAQAAASRAERCEELVRMGVLLRIAAEGKLAALDAWVKSFLESGESLVLFGKTVETLKAVAGKFKAPLIIGETSTAKRQEHVDRFQAGKIPLLCLSYAAGGVGLTLTKASNVASIELPWTAKDLDQGEDRCHRRGQRDSVNCWHFLARGTVDYVVRDLVLNKAQISEETLK